MHAGTSETNFFCPYLSLSSLLRGLFTSYLGGVAPQTGNFHNVLNQTLPPHTYLFPHPHLHPHRRFTPQDSFSRDFVTLLCLLCLNRV